jgi:recombination protein RecR
MPDSFAESLASALMDVKRLITLCSTCCNLAEQDPCPICASPDRDPGRICVVEEPLDVLAIERIGEYRGVYHVLHGAISPQDGIGPDHLKLGELARRVQRGGIAEVILATNPTQIGTATAYFARARLREVAPTLTITLLARGLPMGGDLEYADDVTLSRALANRIDLG